MRSSAAAAPSWTEPSLRHPSTMFKMTRPPLGLLEVGLRAVSRGIRVQLRGFASPSLQCLSSALHLVSASILSCNPHIKPGTAYDL